MRAAAAAFLIVTAIGCGSDPPAALVVDLRTDLVAGREFSRIVVQRANGSSIPEPVPAGDEVALAVRPLTDFTTARRVAELSAPPAGTVTVRLRLLDRDLDVVIERIARVQSAGGTTAVTIVITRDCLDVSCPAGQTCHAGACADPACPDDPGACPDGSCVESGECESEIACAVPLCVATECFLEAHDERCPSGRRCDVGIGCVPDPGPEGIMPPPGPGPDPEPPCGDGVCELPGENRCSCADDCPSLQHDGCCEMGETACNEYACPAVVPGDGCCHPRETECIEGLCAPRAGDGCCSAGEEPCLEPACPGTCSTCGDGICQDYERCSKCLADCVGMCDCNVRCCDGELLNLQSDTPEGCRSMRMCEEHGFTWHRRWEGTCVYQRPTHCGCCGTSCPMRCEDGLTECDGGD